MKPLPHQYEVLQSNAKVKLVVAPRWSGKTTLASMLSKQYNYTFWFSPISISFYERHRLNLSNTQFIGVTSKNYWDASDYYSMLEFKNQLRFIGRSDLIVINEADFIGDEMFNAILNVSPDNPKLIISTVDPTKRESFFEHIFYTMQGDVERFRWGVDTYLGSNLSDIKKEVSREIYKTQYEGKWVHE